MKPEGHDFNATSDPTRSNGAHASHDPGDALAALAKFLKGILAAGGQLIAVYKDRARLSTRRMLTALAGGACAAVLGAVALGASAIAVLRGLCGGFTELWGGRVWLGDLSGGLVAVVLIAMTFAAFVRMSERRWLTQLIAKYDKDRHEDESTEPVAALSTENGREAT